MKIDRVIPLFKTENAMQFFQSTDQFHYLRFLIKYLEKIITFDEWHLLIDINQNHTSDDNRGHPRKIGLLSLSYLSLLAEIKDGGIEVVL